jgi:hypothetical protein
MLMLKQGHIHQYILNLVQIETFKVQCFFLNIIYQLQTKTSFLVILMKKVMTWKGEVDLEG